MIKTERRTRDEKYDDLTIKSSEIGTKNKILKDKEKSKEHDLENVLASTYDSTMSATEYADMLEEMYE